jgi:hypothetical protein
MWNETAVPFLQLIAIIWLASGVVMAKVFMDARHQIIKTVYHNLSPDAQMSEMFYKVRRMAPWMFCIVPVLIAPHFLWRHGWKFLTPLDNEQINEFAFFMANAIEGGYADEEDENL